MLTIPVAKDFCLETLSCPRFEPATFRYRATRFLSRSPSSGLNPKGQQLRQNRPEYQETYNGQIIPNQAPSLGPLLGNRFRRHFQSFNPLGNVRQFPLNGSDVFAERVERRFRFKNAGRNRGRIVLVVFSVHLNESFAVAFLVE